MARKTFEMAFQIGGKLASSFSSAFSGAKSSLVGLQNQARQTQRALDQLGNDFRKGKIDQAQYAEATQRLTNELGKLERAQKRIDGFKTSVSQGFDTVKSAASIAAVGTAAAATAVAMDSMNKAASFEKQITKVGVVAGASSEEMKKLSNTALELGASTSLSSSEVAVAMGELAAKGMDTNKIIGAMPGILAAAEASGEDLAMTSDVVTSALNAFGLQASQASQVADVMSMSANKTAAGVEDLGYSFKYAAPVANTLGMSLEELAAATGLMVNKGLTGEQAGTSLRMALIRLAKPPKAASKALDKLNLSVTDSQGKFKSLSKITEEWNESTKDLSQTQKVAYAADVFGVEAATGMLNLFASGPEEIDKLTTSLEKSGGAAEKAAKAMKDNYAGSLDQLKGSIESAQIKFATPILPVFQELFDGISSGLDQNVGGIEKAGERVANALKDVFEPFSTQKPEKPKKEQFDSIYIYQEVMAQYEKDLAKFNKFEKMDFGDKVVYGLDEAASKTSTWLEGSGGESMNKIFTKLGEIAAKAWYTAFTNTVKTSMSEFGEGNVASGAGLGVAAWMMGGGLLAKGAWGAGKGILGKVKGAKGGKVPASAVPKGGTSTVGTGAATGSRVANRAAQTTGTLGKATKYLGKAAPILSKGAKIIGKAALPLAVVGSAVSIATSKDKVKTTVSEGGGIAGGLAGAKLGAVIGTAIAPGIGTAIGGLLGGAGGYIAGKWIGNKAVDTARQSNNTAQPTTAAASTPTASNTQSSAALNQATTQLKSAVALSAHNYKSLATYAGQATVTLVGGFNGIKSSTTILTHNLTALTTWTGQASGWMVGSFTGIKSSADLVNHNLKALATWTGQASGWMASLNKIPTASGKVETALNNLATRINNVKVPSSVGGSGGNKRTSYNEG